LIEVAEHALALLLALSRKVAFYHLATKQGRYELQAGPKLRRIEGQTLGIVGLGAIGRRIATIASAFGMRVTALKRTTAAAVGVERTFGPGQLVPFLKEAEYVVNTLPLTPQTRGYFGAQEFAAMRSDAVFINIGRGGTVQTAALLHALQSGSIAGAALDVTDPEPLPSEHPLWAMDNVILTPHYAGAHPGYVQRASAIFLENLARFVAGAELTNVVDKQAGY